MVLAKTFKDRSLILKSSFLSHFGIYLDVEKLMLFLHYNHETIFSMHGYQKFFYKYYVLG